MTTLQERPITQEHRPYRVIMQDRKTGEMVMNTSCTGCSCHEENAPMPNLVEGNCVDCSCPHTFAAFLAFKAEYGLYKRSS